MKKFSIFIITIVTLFAPIFFCNAESVAMSTSNVTKDKATLNISGLTIASNYYLNLKDSSGVVGYKSIIPVSNNYSVSYGALNSSTTYTASIYSGMYESGSPLSTASFKTLDNIITPETINPTLAISAIGSDSVSLTVGGFPTDGSQSFKIDIKDSNSKVVQTIEKSLNGTFKISGLSSGVSYSAFLYLGASETASKINGFTTLISGSLSASTGNVTSKGIKLNVTIVKGSNYFVQVYKKGSTTPVAFVSGTSTGNSASDVVNFVDKLNPSTSYTASLFLRGSEVSLFDYDFFTSEASTITISTYNLSGTTAGLEFNGLKPTQAYTAFIKNDDSSGNTKSYSMEVKLPADNKNGSRTVMFDNLDSNSVYIGGIVGDVTIKFITTEASASSLDFKIFYETLTNANNLYSSSIEGTSAGNYTVGSRAELKKVIDDIPKNIETVSGLTQAEIDGYVTELETAITLFGSKVVGGVVTPKTTTDTTVKSGFFGKGGGILPSCPDTGCGFNDLMKAINNVITFLIFTIATPLAALGIMYAGWLYLSSGGSEENVTKAKHILKNIVLGYVIALAAWLIVHTILSTLGFTGDSFLG